MRVRLNLATKAQETHRRFMVVAGLVGVVAGIVFLAMGWHVYSIRNVDARPRAQSKRERVVHEYAKRKRPHVTRGQWFRDHAHDRARVRRHHAHVEGR